LVGPTVGDDVGSNEGTRRSTGTADRSGAAERGAGGAAGGSDADSRRGEPDDQGAAFSIARWFTLTGERWEVVGVFTLAVFGVVVALGVAGVVDVSRAGRVSTAFSTTVTGLFTLVTITVSINQLVLSRVLGSPERIRERTESVEEFRDVVTDESERVSVAPTEPAGFLEVVTSTLADHARRLDAAFEDGRDPRIRGEVSGFTAELVGLAEDVDDRLGDDQLELFDVLLPVLGNRYSSYVHTVDRIRATTDDLTEAEEIALDELREALVEVNRTRHYFKTLYLHEALSSLSLLILASGSGALVVCFVVILSYGAPPAGAKTAALVGVSGALALALVPLALLFAFGARAATIAGQTTTFGTFTPVEENP
jgi:hypothetical protein